MKRTVEANSKDSIANMSVEDAIKRLNELAPRQAELNIFMKVSRLSWQNPEHLNAYPEVREAFDIWNEARELSKVIYQHYCSKE